MLLGCRVRLDRPVTQNVGDINAHLDQSPSGKQAVMANKRLVLGGHKGQTSKSRLCKGV